MLRAATGRIPPFPYVPLCHAFGAVIEKSNDDLLTLNVETVAQVLNDRSAVVFRGFEATPEQFVQFTDKLMRDFSTYQGGAFRGTPFDRSSMPNNATVLTATGTRQDFPILLHGEMYYSGNPPEIISFYCERPALAGGETTLGDAATIWTSLTPETQCLFSDSQISYVRSFDNGEWQLVFGLNTPEAVTDLCARQRTTASWAIGGYLQTDYRCSAVLRDRNSKPLFINSILVTAIGEIANHSGIAASMSGEANPLKMSLLVRLEDGSRIPNRVLRELLIVSESVTVPVQWQPGDLIMIDNTRVMHGRRASHGGDRKIYTRMGTANFARP